MDIAPQRAGSGSDRVFRVIPGLHEPLEAVTNHQGVPGIDRFLLLTEQAVPGRSFHLAAHIVTDGYVPDEDWQFSHRHSHDFDELNVLIPSGEGLRYRYEVDGEIHMIEGPCSTFIPAGTEHRMEPVEGSGIFLCIQLPNPPRGETSSDGGVARVP